MARIPFSIKLHKIVNGKDGAPGDPGPAGKDAVMLVADKSALLISCDSAGNPKAESLPDSYYITVNVMKGGAVDSGWTINAGGKGCGIRREDTPTSLTLRLQSLSSSNASISLLATKSGYSALKLEIPVQKVMDGSGSSSSGKNGCTTPPPMRWRDYPSNYEFQAGNPDAGDTRWDCVLANEPNENGTFNAYYCIQNHTKSSVSSLKDYDFEQDTQRWRAADIQGMMLISTMVFLAQNAYIDFLGANGINVYDNYKFGSYYYKAIVSAFTSNDGAHVFNGIKLPFFVNGLIPVESPPNVSTVPSAPKFGITPQGKIYSGGLDGQHIEIDPIEKAIFVYDKSGALCAVHSGRTITVDEVISRGTIKQTVKADSLSINTMANGTFVSSTPLQTVQNNGTVTFKVPSISVTAITRGVSSTGFQASGTVKVEVLINGVVKRSYTANSANIGGMATISAFEVTESISKGQSYQLRITLSATVTSVLDPSVRGTVSVAPSKDVEIEANATVTIMEYGANGFFGASNTQNYYYHLFDENGVLHTKCVSNGNVIYDSKNN